MKFIAHGLFQTHTNGGAALEALSASRIAPERIRVIGEDGDAFRDATAVLQTKKVCNIIISLAVLGSAIGAVAGYLGMPSVSAQVIPSTISGSLAGLVLGLFSGIWMAGVIHLDNMPDSDADIKQGKVQAGEMLISVSSSDSAECERIRAVMQENAATQTSIEMKENLTLATA